MVHSRWRRTSWCSTSRRAIFACALQLQRRMCGRTRRATKPDSALRHATSHAQECRAGLQISSCSRNSSSASKDSKETMLKFPRRQFLRFVTGAAAFTTASKFANAQTYPSRPITVIVPTGAGGPQDVVARIVTEHMRNSLGQAVIIENVAGANGTLGIGRVARATPDGYTLAFSVSSSTHVVNAAIYALPYDVINDFDPIALAANTTGTLILAKKSMPANDLNELIAWL